MLNLQEGRKKFFDGDIDRHSYLEDVHSKHQTLFEFSDILKETDLNSIKITADGIFYESHEGCLFRENPNGLRTVFRGKLAFGKDLDNYTAFVDALAKEATTILDIGANIGWISIHLANHYPQATVYSFEPSAGSFDLLTENISLNKNIQNIKTFDICLSDSEGVVDFYYYPELSGTSGLRDNLNIENTVCAKVTANTLDRICELNMIEPDFIKIDVEGAELSVLTGGVETIKSNKPIIIAEMLRKWSSSFDYHPNEIILLLREIGYMCYTFSTGKIIEFSNMDETTLDTNFLFLHSVKHSNMLNSFR